MFLLLSFFNKYILNIPATKKNLVIIIAILKKELEIYRRQNTNKRMNLK